MNFKDIDKIVEWGVDNILKNLSSITELSDVIAITTALATIKYGEKAISVPVVEIVETECKIAPFGVVIAEVE